MISRAANFCFLDVHSIFLNYSKYKDIIAAAALNWETINLTGVICIILLFLFWK